MTQDKDNADGKGKRLNCPTCGSKTTLKPDENVAELLNNEFAIKLLAAVVPNRSQMGGAVCSYCRKEPSTAARSLMANSLYGNPAMFSGFNVVLDPQVGQSNLLPSPSP